MSDRTLIPHLDDLGVTHGSVVSFRELVDHGIVTSGSVMVPCPWFPELAATARARPDLDIGIHLTLTSESVACRWRPISTRSPASGLLDDDGYLWPDTRSVRRNADVGAVAEELQAQVEAALAAGIDVTHLDHHMGAAMTPEFAAVVVELGEAFEVPVLFPRDLDGYFRLVDCGPVELRPLEEIGEELDRVDRRFVDRFLMPLSHSHDDVGDATRRMLLGAGAGVTYLSLHCNVSGEVEAVHPLDAHWRIAEDALFRQSGFATWLEAEGFRLADMRGFRDGWRSHGAAST